ncbi:MAG TPA: hypothetical protein VHN14_15910 [Kofleriaceae bacterium]|jgi:hypothetical protein|nr:hypothetical protein [Kofleriaceae bacterium]
MRSHLIAGTLALVTGACSSDAPVLLDAAPSVDAPRLCLLPGEYGALGNQIGMPNVTTANSLTIVLDPGPPKDDLFFKLNAGQGVFAGGALTTGTFSIAGADANLNTCGLCTTILADIDPSLGPAKFYTTSAGMITLTSTNPIAGSAKDLHFVEINLGTGAAIPGGCTATIASISFGT